jgi:hypothetical protein
MISSSATLIIRHKDDKMPLIEEPGPEQQQQDASEFAQRTERIRIKNRRKMYLDRHPSYFTSPDLELAGALIFTISKSGLT